MPETRPEALTVSAVAKFLSALVADNCSKLWIRGEVSNLKFQNTGNVFLSLKDSDSKLNAVIMNFSRARSVSKDLKEGVEILAFGNLSYYKRDGYVSLFIEEIEFVGLGLLKQKFDELKSKLEKEGLFDRAHKKPLPAYPTHVGVVTSPTGAAFQDILNVTRRRFQSVDIVLFPASVQGDRAAEEIARAIRAANKAGRNVIDVLIVGRGGGAIEDLWCFNEEAVARAIYKSEIPVISAVGHEIDYTIADYVADVRAPTPSAAAELVVKDKSAIVDRIRTLKNRVDTILQTKLEHVKIILANRGGEAVERLARTYAADLEQEFTQLRLRFDASVNRYIDNFRRRIDVSKGKLSTLNPKGILERGYSITYKVTDKGAEQVVKRASQVEPGDKLKTVVADGEFYSIGDA